MKASGFQERGQVSRDVPEWLVKSESRQSPAQRFRRNHDGFIPKSRRELTTKSPRDGKTRQSSTRKAAFHYETARKSRLAWTIRKSLPPNRQGIIAATAWRERPRRLRHF